MIEIPTTGSRGQPLKIAQYIAEGRRLVEAVEALRAARDEALLQSDAPASEAPGPTKRKSYKLPPLSTPTEIPGYPLNPSLPAEVPEYGSISRVKAIRATQAARRGKKAPMTPSGPSELRKKGRGRP
jgi:hypothetical protein